MSTQLATIEKMPFNEMMQTAKLFAESGMFTDTKTNAQALVKIMAGQEIGVPAFASMAGVHIIMGKPVIGAGLMASRVKGSGKYNYKIIEHTDKKCVLDFYEGAEKLGTSEFTIEDTKRANTKNMEKHPKNMLFARAISNGVKFFTPDIFSSPVYVPEEMEQPTTHDVQHTEVHESTSESVEAKVIKPTVQPTIDNYVHAVNGVKKSTTFEELMSYTNRMTLETISHPAVQDAICVFMIQAINSCENESALKSTWTSIGIIGKDKEFQKIKVIIEAKDKMKETFKAIVK